MEADPRCPCCSEKYGTDDDARLPIVLSCLCRVCKGCALTQEAEAAAAAAAAAGGKKKKGKGKGKKKKKEEVVQNNGMACRICEKVCTTPVADLPVDIAIVKSLQSRNTDASEIPLCEFCASDRATKYCGDCAMQRMLCDSCHTAMHRSAQKQGHAAIPIEEHLASAGSHGGGGCSAAHPRTTMCSIHTGQPLQVFCNTCNILVCSLCAVVHHNGHDLTPIEQAADAHRETIEAALAAVTISRVEVVAAIAAIKVIKGQLEGNKDAAMAVIEEGFKKLMRAAKERKDALKKVVQGAYDEKLKALIAQLSALEDVDSNSEAAMALIAATLAAATPTELLARSSLLENGLGQLQAHGVALEECEVSNMTVQLAKPFEETANDLRAIGWLDTSATHAAASTAAGGGLKSAVVGKEATFVVTAFEVSGAGKKPRTRGGDDVTIRFVCVRGDGEDEDSAEDNRGGGGAAAAAKSGKRKRGSAAGGGKGRAGAKKSKTGASTSSSGGGGGAAAATNDADDADFDDILADNGDGTYTCSYTPPEGAEIKQWQLEVLLNGKQIAGSPFAVEVKCLRSIKYVFRSVATEEYALSEGNEVATKKKDSWRGAIADGQFIDGGAGAGAAAVPMIEGQEYAEFEVVKNELNGSCWMFGVCGPGIDWNDAASELFYERDDTWMMGQNNTPQWSLFCNSNKGNIVKNSIKRKLNAGDRVGLLLDLDNGGTLTLYLDGKPCGTIAEGLVGPLHWCITSYCAGKAVKIHAGLEIPSQ